MLPKTPSIVFPVNPKEYFLKRNPMLKAPKIPNNILVRDSIEAVKSFEFNVRNPCCQFYRPSVFFE